MRLFAPCEPCPLSQSNPHSPNSHADPTRFYADRIGVRHETRVLGSIFADFADPGIWFAEAKPWVIVLSVSEKRTV